MGLPTAPTPPRYWRGIPQHYRLEAARCVAAGCNEVSFPPRAVCASCGGRESVVYPLPREGKLLSFSVLQSAPPDFALDPPYAVGLIELSDGTRLTAQVTGTDLENLHEGMAVRYAFRKVQQDGEAGTLLYGYKFVPARLPEQGERQ